MASHTATGEWKSFEIRMRRRRAERLVLRASVAADAGCFDEARAAIDEARTLWLGAPGLADLEQRLTAETLAPPTRSRRRTQLAVAAAVIAIAASGTAALLSNTPAGVHETAPPASRVRVAAGGVDLTPVAPLENQSVPVPAMDALASVPSLPAASRASLQAPTVNQDPLVRAALTRYADAYSELDVDAAARVWPSVNRSALARAFDSLASQRVSLESCDIQVDGDAARALCAGSATWAPKVGGGERTDPRSWDFALERSGAGWQVVSARVQNR